MSARRDAWISVFAATALSVACGQLIGAEFDDLEPLLDASAGDSGNAGTDGNGGTAGSGGASGASGTLGSGGDGGSQATGGSAGTLGNGGTGGTAGSSGTAGTSGASGSAGSSGATGSGGVDGGGTAGSGGTAGTAGSAGASGSAGSGGVVDAGNGVLVINEVEGRAGNEDFIELHNLGPGPLDIGGHKVTDAVNVNQGPKINEAVVFPTPTIVPPGGYVLVVGNQPTFGGPVTCLGFTPCFTATWGVSAGGERVYLLRPDNTEIQQVDYPSETSDAGLLNGQSLGRIPNGTGDFTRTTISPGRANVAAP